MDKKKTFVTLLLIGLAILWIWFVGDRQTSAPLDRAGPATYAATTSGDRLLVDLDNDLSRAEVREVEQEYGLKLSENSRFSFAQRLFGATVKGRKNLKGLLARLRADPRVELAELDQVYSIPPLEAGLTVVDAQDEDSASFPNDPKYKHQWHLRQINMPGVWPGATGEGVIVAVIDTGVAYMDQVSDLKKKRRTFRQVPDLKGTRFVQGYDFINNRVQALDDHGHGTHVAGTIAQATHNGVGVAGTAHGATIMPIKVLNQRGMGNMADIAEAIRFAADNGAKVINMSLGGGGSSRIMASAVKYANMKGVVVVCAAGNESRGRVGYPAAYPHAIAVAATQYDRTTTFYSNWGKEIDVAAPGGNTREDQNGDGLPDGVLQNTILPGRPELNEYLMFMGTSMASPHVAGVAALIMQRGVTKPAAVERLLKQTANHPDDQEWDEHYGAGIIDAEAALSRAKNSWGGHKVLLSSALGLIMLMGLGRRRALLPGPGMVLGLLLGSAGLFFLSGLGLPGPLDTLLTRGMPAWGLMLGPAWRGLPLLMSAIVPLGLTVGLWQLKKARGLLFGLCIGFAAHLLFHVFFDTADVRLVPDMLDGAWLAINSVVCLGLAGVLGKK